MEDIDKGCGNCKWMPNCYYEGVAVCPKWEEDE